MKFAQFAPIVLRRFAAVVAFLGLVVLATVGQANSLSGATILFLAALIPALLVLVVIHLPGAARTFAIGAMFPSSAAFIGGFGTLALGGGDLQPALEEIALSKLQFAAAWVMAAVVGLSCIGFRHLFLVPQAHSVSPLRPPQFGLRGIFISTAVCALWGANYRFQASRAQAEQQTLMTFCGAPGAKVVAVTHGWYPRWFRYLLGPSFHNAEYEVVLPVAQLNAETVQRLEKIPHLGSVTLLGPPMLSEADVVELADQFPSVRNALYRGFARR